VATEKASEGQTATHPPETAASPHVVTLREEMRRGTLKREGAFRLGDLEVEIRSGRDSLWCLIRRDGAGGLALRTAYLAGASYECRKLRPEGEEVLRLEVTSALGRHVVSFASSEADLHRLQAKVRFTPAADMRFPFIPRDLYPFDERGNPIGTAGNVEAAQRGLNAGLVYFRVDKPAFGSVLYFQDLTALNPYFLATGTKPEGVVGGHWPELGYQPPTPENQQAGDACPLKAGEELVLSSAIIVLRDWAGDNEQEMARQFLQMLGIAYKALELPAVEYRDWVARAELTLRDLRGAEQARQRHYGNLYLMPYPDGEEPDVMIQLSVIQALHEYGKWTQKRLPIEAQLMKGLAKFYDPEFKTLRRFLPNVGKAQGKDRDAIDSWYLYHPLLNLGRLALDGDDAAKELLFKSIDYGIRAAKHFDYAWPIQYKIQDFSVIQQARGGERFGQTDVGGIYAYVMLQCFELTGEDRFVREARAALDKAKGLRFDLLYQANLTVWGAVACLRLWRITDEIEYLKQSYAYVAGFFHNAIIWQSQLGTARHFKTFLGASCLHDAPYMAMYECFESFAGFEEYLAQAGPNLEPAVRMMVGEYCKYVIDRAWFYYPDTLPKEAIHEGKHQSGVVNPDLSFPLEDLYPDGQQAGQVGQEIYGCGAAFVFASRSHHHVAGAPFLLYCNQFIRASERTGERALSIQLDGGETCVADISLVRLKRRTLPKARIVTAGGDAIRPRASSRDRIDFLVPASGRVILSWD
jgi:hypothetical protein